MTKSFEIERGEAFVEIINRKGEGWYVRAVCCAYVVATRAEFQSSLAKKEVFEMTLTLVSHVSIIFIPSNGGFRH